ncbi:MAG: hypothetical protein CBB68_05535 [Rhodospirillaceae bacterium TMED8]|nr:hypothetical protein [Magnetovibrio sp.]OUT51456.1 MAG: hypothetical protein CBB68_05535 [Rhodospirillaceae bacterium TMED8]
MTVKLYDLCGKNDIRFSPFCWRIRMALLHKGIMFETVPVRFTEKHKLEFSGQYLMPVIDSDGTVVSDSWAIAEYLDDTFEPPTLFPTGREQARAQQKWLNTLHPLIAKSIIMDIHNVLSVEDQTYFRAKREAMFGVRLEEVQAGRETTREQFRIGIEPLRKQIANQPFASGNAPAYMDYIVFSALKWASQVSDFQMLAENDPVALWFDRVATELGVN